MGCVNLGSVAPCAAVRSALVTMGDATAIRSVSNAHKKDILARQWAAFASDFEVLRGWLLLFQRNFGFVAMVYSSPS